MKNKKTKKKRKGEKGKQEMRKRKERVKWNEKKVRKPLMDIAKFNL
jgi:hypothetical protein